MDDHKFTQADLNDGRERHEIRRGLFGLFSRPTAEQRREWARQREVRQYQANYGHEGRTTDDYIH